MSDKTQKIVVKQQGSIGFFGILTIIFITLKLIGVIEWSWVWVLSPIWIGAIFYVGIFALFFVVALVAALLAAALDS
jgi:hypothetical protein